MSGIRGASCLSRVSILRICLPGGIRLITHECMFSALPTQSSVYLMFYLLLGS